MRDRRPETKLLLPMQDTGLRCVTAAGATLFLTRNHASEHCYSEPSSSSSTEDLSVELIQDPATYLGLDFDAPYDASLLYNADAPLPSRASTMLGAALRD